MTRETRNALVPSSKASPKVRTSSLSSRSRLAKRLDEDFWKDWLNSPEIDVAEAIIRLRRLREMTQAELAEKVGTKQPAIARIERGKANVGIETLKRIAEALDAAVRLDIEPWEVVCKEFPSARWWERAFPAHEHHSRVTEITFIETRYHVTVNLTMISEGEIPRRTAEIPHRTFELAGSAISTTPLRTYDDK